MKNALRLALLLFLLCPTIYAAVPSYVSTNGLAGWYSFNSNANDESGLGNNGTVVGATLTNDRFGNFNGAYRYNGSNNYIQLPSTFLGGVQVSTFTIHSAFKVFSFPNTQGYGQNIWGKELFWGEVNVELAADSTLRLFFANSYSGNKYSVAYTASGSIHSNQWTTVDIVYQNSNAIVYINGVQVPTSLVWYTQSGALISTAQIESVCNFAASAGSCRFGTRKVGGVWGSYLDGIIDEFGIWNRALSAAEILQLHTAQAPCSLTSNIFSIDTLSGCGNQFTLDAGNPGSSYVWSTGATTQNINVNTSGWYSCTVSQGAGCSVTDSVFVSLPNALPSNLQSGLVGYWPFCGNANDESGNGNNGVGTSILSISDRFNTPNSAYLFDGTASGISLPINNNFPIGNSSRSIAVWFKMSLPLINPTYSSLVRLGNNSLGERIGLQFGNNKLLVEFVNSAVETPFIPDSNWHHIVVTYPINGTGSNSILIYIDGSLRSGYTFIQPISILNTSANPSNGLVYSFGTLYNLPGYFWGGLLDDICIWNRALSSTEIQQLYQNQNPCTLTSNFFSQDTLSGCGNLIALDAGNPGSTYLWSTGVTTQTINVTTSGWYSCTVSQGTVCSVTDSVFVSLPNALPSNLQSGLVGYWPFCGNANDESGNENNGTVLGATLTSDRNGVTNSAYAFDGISNYIETVNFFRPDADFTLSLWVISSSTAPQALFNTVPHTLIAYGLNPAWAGPSTVTFLYGTGQSNGWYNSGSYFVNPNSYFQWTQHTIVKSGSSVSIYQNGVLVHSLTTIASPASILAKAVFGHCDPAICNETLSGKLDDICSWNRALTPAEVQQLYSTQSSCNLTANFFPQDTIAACGSMYTLDAGNPGSSYLWSAGATTQTINATTSGWFHCTVTQGSCSATDSVFVSLVDAEISNINQVPVCSGDSVSLSVNSNSNVFDTLLIDTYSNTITSNWNRSMITEIGEYYLLRISGLFTYGTYCPSLVNDPAYTLSGYYGLTQPQPINIGCLPDGLYSSINCPSNLMRPMQDTYNPNHTYDYYFVANSTNITMGWHDDMPGDNCGTISFELYKISSPVNYLWSTGATTPSITVSPSQTTTYYVTVSNGISSCTDSVTVTVNQPTSSVDSVSSCGSYTWNGETYTQSGSYTYTATNALGCDSTATLILTILPLSASHETIAACDEFTWQVTGLTYTQSGTYSYASGCSSAVLELSINPSVVENVTATACDNYTWNGETYSQSGTYSYVTTTVNGCDSTILLQLTINESSSSEQSATACAAYQWNGTTYTASGVYSFVSTNAADCDSTAYLSLTINMVYSSTVQAAVCSGTTYTLPDGNTVSQAGTYITTFTAANSCDSVITTILTLLPQPIVTATASSIACFGGTATVTVAASGGTSPYTGTGSFTRTAGTYSFTVTDNNGCSGSATVSITQPASLTASVTTQPASGLAANGSATVVAGGGTGAYNYLWSNGGTTATITGLPVGNYTVTVTDANGCTRSASGTVVSTNVGCSGFLTYTATQWGAPNGSSTAAAYIKNRFAVIFRSPTFLTIGCSFGNKLRLTNYSAVDAFLPSSGPAALLPRGTTTNPRSFQNQLAGEVVALTLNVQADATDAAFAPSSLLLRNLLVAAGPFAGYSVQQVLDEANRWLGGCGSVFTPAQLLAAVSAINANYQNGTVDLGYLICPVSVRMENTAMQAPADPAGAVVYPNPTSGNCTLDFMVTEPGTVDVAMMNTTGQLVWRQTSYIETAGKQSMNIAMRENGLAPGLYLLRISYGGRVEEKRIVVEY